MGNKEIEKQCKVILIGEFGVGKKSIIKRFILNTFEDNLVSFSFCRKT